VRATVVSLMLTGCTPIVPDTHGGGGFAERDVHEAPTAPPGLLPGFVLLSDLTTTFPSLRDAWGRVVHTWQRPGALGLSAELLEDGSLLRAVDPIAGTGESHGRWDAFGGGLGGRIERVAWDGTLLWSYELASDTRIQHHAVEAMPNGHVLAVSWSLVDAETAIAAGRDPQTVDADGLWMDSVQEIAPVGVDGGAVVWEWHAADHLGEGPRKLDVGRSLFAFPRDWSHVNAVTYDAERDEVLLSSRTFSEVWVLDHSTTTEEAAGEVGGRHGVGGDLVYRWGNPEAYGAGGPQDQRLFVQHDVRVLPEGWEGAGDYTVFNNGPLPHHGRSAVTQWTPPRDDAGHYLLEAGRFGPDEPVWEVSPDLTPTFLSGFMSGAQRLPDGTTMVVESLTARVSFLDVEGEVLYTYDESDRVGPSDLGGFFRGEWYPLHHPGVRRLLP
jgi:hypothetical protein